MNAQLQVAKVASAYKKTGDEVFQRPSTSSEISLYGIFSVWFR